MNKGVKSPVKEYVPKKSNDVISLQNDFEILSNEGGKEPTPTEVLNPKTAENTVGDTDHGTSLASGVIEDIVNAANITIGLEGDKKTRRRAVTRLPC